MLRGGRRNAAFTVVLAALLSLPAAAASATTFGSNLQAPPNAGVCATEGGAGEASCTFMQLLLAEGHTAAGGVQPRDGGVVTRWRVSSGLATAATARVQVRLRVLDAGRGSSALGGTPYEDLPLAQAGIHSFPARLPIGPQQMLGLETLVTGLGGEASAPLAHRESEVGLAFRWTPALGEAIPFPSAEEKDTELLFNAVVERDRDEDGYGDRTQDRCPEDPTRQRNCDRRPPRTYLTYAPRQDFLHTKRLVVYLRSSEEGTAYAGGGIEIPSIHTIWLTYHTHTRVERGEKARLVLRVPGNASRAVARAVANGRRVLAKVDAYAVDAVGNQGGATVATIRPKR